jgi:hemerythrin-like domain-containing protein
MARSTSTSGRSSDAPRDAIALLKQDHRTVSQLFEEFENADEEEQASIAKRVCQLLTVHAQIEEELLYPAAKEAFDGDEEDEDLVNEAEVEHGSAKELIAKIEAMASEDEHFKATVSVLGEYIKHHVKEEEGELFPQLKKTELDLKELGSRLADRKFALMEQMGIEEQEQEAPQARKRSAGRATRGASRSKSSRGRSASRARH